MILILKDIQATLESDLMHCDKQRYEDGNSERLLPTPYSLVSLSRQISNCLELCHKLSHKKSPHGRGAGFKFYYRMTLERYSAKTETRCTQR